MVQYFICHSFIFFPRVGIAYNAKRRERWLSFSGLVSLSHFQLRHSTYIFVPPADTSHLLPPDILEQFSHLAIAIQIHGFHSTKFPLWKLGHLGEEWGGGGESLINGLLATSYFKLGELSSFLTCVMNMITMNEPSNEPLEQSKQAMRCYACLIDEIWIEALSGVVPKKCGNGLLFSASFTTPGSESCLASHYLIYDLILLMDVWSNLVWCPCPSRYYTVFITFSSMMEWNMIRKEITERKKYLS